ncbi:hypothetical protein V6Z11_A11G164500 [Gossypium hirsutum]
MSLDRLAFLTLPRVSIGSFSPTSLDISQKCFRTALVPTVTDLRFLPQNPCGLRQFLIPKRLSQPNFHKRRIQQDSSQNTTQAKATQSQQDERKMRQEQAKENKNTREKSLSECSQGFFLLKTQVIYNEGRGLLFIVEPPQI